MSDTSIKRPPTVVDVARRAKVSQGTVSRYLNGLSIREDNRERVAAAIEEMNYTRNAIASGLRATNRKLIGLLVPAFAGFHARLLGALATRLSKEGIGTLTMSHDSSPASIKEALACFQMHRVDSIVISGSENCSDELLALERRGVRIIVYDNLPTEGSFSSVTVNNRDISEQAVSELLDLGHRDIAVLCGEAGSWTANERLEGWRSAFKRANLTAPANMMRITDWSQPGGYEAFRSICETSGVPTAVYVANHTMTRGVLKYCRETKIVIPDDLSVISFDDADLFEHTTPPITGIAQPVTCIADGIKSILERLVYQNRPGQAERHVLQCQINRRASIARPRAGHNLKVKTS